MNPEAVLCEMEFYGMSELTEEIAANQVCRYLSFSFSFCYYWVTQHNIFYLFLYNNNRLGQEGNIL